MGELIIIETVHMNEDDEIERSVQTHGWHAVNISDHEPPFVYTIGLMPHHPELIIFGLDPETANGILNVIVHETKQGRSFDKSVTYENVLESGNIAIRPVHVTQHPLFLGYAMAYCRRLGRPGSLKAMQVFWPDTNGKFPFDAGCELDVYHSQPRLDIGLTPSELAEWKREWQ